MKYTLVIPANLNSKRLKKIINKDWDKIYYSAYFI